MTRAFCIVKGTLGDAQACASALGLSAIPADSKTFPGECHVYVTPAPGEACALYRRLATWLSSDSGKAPFPAGALLWFSLE